MKRVVLAFAAGMLLVVGVVLWFVYREHAENYAVEREERTAVARVVSSTFAGKGDLRVGTLSGTVQSVATDTRGFGLLTSDQVVKAPYSVDYFVDVSELGLDDYVWDAGSRTLTVRMPPVTVGQANVDEGRRTLVRTRGLVVTRGAAEKLAQATSQRAQRLAQAKAEEPEQIARARERARTAVASLLRAPLAAAGVEDIRVRAVFSDEVGQTNTDRWDVTRSLQEVLADPKYR